MMDQTFNYYAGKISYPQTLLNFGEFFGNFHPNLKVADKEKMCRAKQNFCSLPRYLDTPYLNTILYVFRSPVCGNFCIAIPLTDLRSWGM